MPGGERKPIEGGLYDAREVARRVRRAWEKSDIPAKQIIAKLGLRSESAWTKRVSPDRSDWVPLRVDELSALKDILGTNEPPGWPLLDETASRITREAFSRAFGADSPPPQEPASPPAPASASSAQTRRRRRAGGR